MLFFEKLTVRQQILSPLIVVLTTSILIFSSLTFIAFKHIHVQSTILNNGLRHKDSISEVMKNVYAARVTAIYSIGSEQEYPTAIHAVDNAFVLNNIILEEINIYPEYQPAIDHYHLQKQQYKHFLRDRLKRYITEPESRHNFDADFKQVGDSLILAIDELYQMAELAAQKRATEIRQQAISILGWSCIGFSLGLLLAFALSIKLSNIFAKRSLLFREGMRAFFDGNYDYKIESKGYNEFSEMAFDYNLTAKQLKHTVTSTQNLSNTICHHANSLAGVGAQIRSLLEDKALETSLNTQKVVEAVNSELKAKDKPLCSQANTCPKAETCARNRLTGDMLQNIECALTAVSQSGQLIKAIQSQCQEINQAISAHKPKKNTCID